jgi:hypothetical protein
MDLIDLASSILTILMSLAIVGWIIRTLIEQVLQDGHGHRPLPRSHETEEETRFQQLQRLS